MNNLYKTLAISLSTTAMMAAPIWAAQAPAADPLVGRAWVETKPQSGLPGVMMVFMADGSLLMDSCWETYALRKWSRASQDTVTWDEDGAKITAKVQSVSPTQLTLRVKAGKDTVEHRYSVAKAPYLCPDMKR
ncbi:hypothetical protein [Rhizobium sp. AN80A]|uniref:hypothetical protein n=1 Tax=Rhizobium sp. AN80A TaxID=3040673 RepID=UPI0024B3A01D|nr:hypothetical protein [Rhizobium sp. AN80A]